MAGTRRPLWMRDIRAMQEQLKSAKSVDRTRKPKIAPTRLKALYDIGYALLTIHDEPRRLLPPTR